MINESYMAYYDLFYKHLRSPENVETHKITKVRKTKNKKILNGISEFSSVLHECFPKECSKRFDDNLKTLRVVKCRLFHDRNKGGEYESSVNKVFLYDYESLMHELFHMASSLISIDPDKDGSKNFVGFRDGPRGIGINEGFTQILALRHFDVRDSYDRLVNVVTKLEYIVGSNKMTRLYFGKGLKGLADELAAYSDENDIMIISNLVDYTDKIYDEKFPSNNRDHAYGQVYDCLLKFYMNKLLSEVINEKITEEEAMDKYTEFIGRLFEEEETNDPLRIKTELFLDKEHVMDEIAKRASMEQYQLDLRIKRHKQKTRRIS